MFVTSFEKNLNFPVETELYNYTDRKSLPSNF